MTFMPLFLNKVLILFLASCAAYPELKVPQMPIEDKEAIATVDDAGTKTAETPNRHLELQLMAASHPNEYYIRLRSDLFEESKDWKLLKRKMTALGAEELASSESRPHDQKNLDVNGFLDFEVIPREKLRYEIWQDGEMKKSIDFKVPFDLVVSGERWLQKEEKEAPRRIFFQPHSVLLTGSHSRSWQVAEVIGAKGAKVAAFLPQHRASASKRGADTGVLKLEVKKLKGEVTFEWQGQNGAHGKAGKNSSKHGLPGLDGEDGSWVKGNRHVGESFCLREPRNGLAGGAGGKGGDGSNGTSGGNTKTLQVLIAQSSPFSKVLWKLQKAQAGEGGKGGLGGRGGRGGAPGRDGGICNKAAHGVRGPNGPRGKNGRPGQSGSFLGVHCLKLAGKTLKGSCEQL